MAVSTISHPLPSLLQRWRDLAAEGAARERVGQVAAAVVLQVGAEVPGRLRLEDANALALDALRYVAASTRAGMFLAPAPPSPRHQAVLGLVAEWSRCWPGVRPFARDYREGAADQVAGEAASMWRDADTCASLLMDGEAGRTFREGAEGHAYAAVALDPGILERVPVRDAWRLASAAEVAAEHSLAHPEAVPGEAVGVEAIRAAALEVKAAAEGWRVRERAWRRLSLAASIGEVLDAAAEAPEVGRVRRPN